MSPPAADRRAPLPLPLEGGASEVQLVERASAAPDVVVVGRRRRAAVSRAPAAKVRLAALQRWFQAVITDPRSAAHGVAAAGALVGSPGLERLVTDGPQLGAVDRLGVYHYAYRARLVECLADDFAALRYALGEGAFDRLAGAVIAARPSRHPNLNGYGANLVAHLVAGEARIAHRGFAADLARLEWALVEALHAAPSRPLDPAALARIPTGRWAQARFTPSPTLRVLTFAFPVNEFLQAWRQDAKPRIPARRPSATAVYRRGWSVWRMDLSAPMTAILAALTAGATLGEALATLERTVRRADRGVVEANVMRWFSEWVAGGFFADVRVRSR